MNLNDFDYILPEQLIAKYPLPERRQSRCLAISRQKNTLTDTKITDLTSFLNPGDLLVFNDTRVIPARLSGVKSTGGKVSLLVERVLPDKQLLVHLKASKAPKVGSRLILSGNIEAQVMARQDDLFLLQCKIDEDIFSWLERVGEVPLPPYLSREADQLDRERYQTVFAREPGAVAAPTAGLHFDDILLRQLQDYGVGFAYLTLHVGAGTFQPIRDTVENHVMHAEAIQIDQELCAQIAETKARGGRVIAVGTTSVRALEAASQDGGLKPFVGDTQLFIKPGYEFKVVDGILTNFHLPKSTLLMLISAFGGHELVMKAYQHAVVSTYRFYSYGDAMLLL